MKRFFDLTFVPFFLLTGGATALAGLIAFWPRWAVETIVKVAFVQEYTIILQHWGIMIGLMGAFMIAAVYRVEWRRPVLIFSAVEKAFMVHLVLANGSYPYAKGFRAGAAMDATVVLYILGYFWVTGSRPQSTKEPGAPGVAQA